MSDIQPLETKYNGYRFRSRLEARWAVFFDSLDIPYEYESEGYDLGECGYYLPDFWLPAQRSWAEVKNGRPSVEERYKAHELAITSGNRVHVLMRGEFEPARTDATYGIAGSLAETFPGRSGTPLEGIDGTEWRYCPKCRTFDICRECWTCGESSHTRSDLPQILAAYAAARSARFEYGERPPTEREV